jgi:hypothetical protein
MSEPQDLQPQGPLTQAAELLQAFKARALEAAYHANTPAALRQVQLDIIEGASRAYHLAVRTGDDVTAQNAWDYLEGARAALARLDAGERAAQHPLRLPRLRRRLPHG